LLPVTKLVSQCEANKESVVFKSSLTEPMAMGDIFQIKIRIKLDLSRMDQEFF